MSTESKLTGLLQVQQGEVGPIAHSPRLNVLDIEPRAAAPVLETSATAAIPTNTSTVAAAAIRFVRRVILSLPGSMDSLHGAMRTTPSPGRQVEPRALSGDGVAASARMATSQRPSRL